MKFHCLLLAGLAVLLAGCANPETEVAQVVAPVRTPLPTNNRARFPYGTPFSRTAARRIRDPFLNPHSTRVDERPIAPAGIVCFVPVGEFPASTLRALQAYFHRRLGMTIRALEPVELDETAYRASHRPYEAYSLLDAVADRYPGLAGDPRVYLVALTAVDIQTPQESQGSLFAAGSPDGHLAIISTARMQPEVYGAQPDPDLVMVRLRKMVTQRIGMMCYHLSTNGDRNSVMFSPVKSVRDLDSIGESF